MVTNMLLVFSVDVYVLLDPGATLSFVTPLVATNFDVLTDFLNEPFMVSNSVDDLVIGRRVYWNCPIILPNRVTHVILVELDRFYFDVIIGIDLLHAFFACINCITGVVKFNFPNENIL